jgi:hypothetical protein
VWWYAKQIALTIDTSILDCDLRMQQCPEVNGETGPTRALQAGLLTKVSDIAALNVDVCSRREFLASVVFEVSVYIRHHIS